MQPKSQKADKSVSTNLRNNLSCDQLHERPTNGTWRRRMARHGPNDGRALDEVHAGIEAARVVADYGIRMLYVYSSIVRPEQWRRQAASGILLTVAAAVAAS